MQCSAATFCNSIPFSLITYLATSLNNVLFNRATAEEMVAAAVTETPGDPVPPNNPTAGSYNSKQSMRSNLVDNAQPMSFTGLPTYDSNV